MSGGLSAGWSRGYVENVACAIAGPSSAIAPPNRLWRGDAPTTELRWVQTLTELSGWRGRMERPAGGLTATDSWNFARRLVDTSRREELGERAFRSPRA
jgi:hypothetical protein